MATQSKEERPLWFSSRNEDGTKETILLIHGSLSSYKEFRPAAEFLRQYHLLIPNLSLNGEGEETGLRRMNLQDTSALLLHLILERAKNSKAHIVTYGMGAHFAVYIAGRAPQHVDSLFLSGVFEFDKVLSMSGIKLGIQVARKKRELDETRPDCTWDKLASRAYKDFNKGTPASDEAYEDAMRVVCQPDDGHRPFMFPIRARTMIIATTDPWYNSIIYATKPEVAIQARNNLSAGEFGCKENVACKMRVIHYWWLQKPELFARCVVAWITKKKLPKSMHILD